jgi:tetratricopeptide (TPR) repeat protein
MTPAPIALFLVVLSLLSVPHPAAAAQAPWIRLSSRNFTIFTDAGEARGRAIAERLESFRRLLVSLFPESNGRPREPETILAFRNDDGLLPFKPLYGDAPAPVAGIYQSASGLRLIALDASADESSYRIVFHEYVHSVLDAWDVPLPLWLNEGIAELYSTADATGEIGIVGTPIASHVEFFRNRPMPPLDVAFGVTPESIEYNEKSAASYFYAESWAVAHYLTFERGVGDRARLKQYAERVAAGEEQAKVFADVFGMVTEDVEREVRLYLRLAELPRTQVRVPPAESDVALRIEPASASDVEAYEGLVLATQGRHSEAEARLTCAADLDRSRALPYEGLGLVALYRNDTTGARAAFAKALEKDPQSFRANYYFARAAILDGAESDDADVVAALMRAVALNPGFAEPYAALSDVARRSGSYPAALDWARRGIALAPGSGELRLALALAQMSLRDYAASRTNLRQVLATEENAAIRGSASVALKWMEVYLAAVDSDTASLAARLDVPVAVMTDLPVFLYLAPAAVRGTLRRIECSGSTTTAYVDIDGTPAVYTSAGKEAIPILTLNHPSTEVIDCDKRIDRQAVLEIEPRGADGRRGILKAIVFLTPLTKPGARRSAAR